MGYFIILISRANGFLLCCLYYLLYFKKIKCIKLYSEGAFRLIILGGSSSLTLNGVKSRSNLNIRIKNGTLFIDDGTFFNNNCSINVMNKIIIGRNCLFGENVKLYDHDHIVDSCYNVSHNEFTEDLIMIGDNCWFGSNVTILKGVSICDNVIIGANSVVTQDVLEPGVYVNKYSSGKLRKLR